MIKKCKYCNKEFIAEYAWSTDKQKTYVNHSVECCSKSCATKAVRTLSEEEIKRRIELCFIHYSDYVTKELLLDYIGVSSKTLAKHKIKIKDENTIRGYFNKLNYFENFVYKALLLRFSETDIEQQKTFPELKHKYQLRYDFYIKSANLLIEADGAQHWDKNSKFYSEISCYRDSLKTNYAKDNNIRLIRIPYERKLSVGYVLSFIY